MKSVLDEDLEILSKSNLAFEQFRGKSILITGATGLIGRDGRSATCARRCCCSAWRPAAWGSRRTWPLILLKF